METSTNAPVWFDFLTFIDQWQPMEFDISCPQGSWIRIQKSYWVVYVEIQNNKGLMSFVIILHKRAECDPYIKQLRLKMIVFDEHS